MVAISVKNVSYAFKGEDKTFEYALKNVSLEINEGEFICLLGRNGSGKSTFAKLLNGLLTPSLGEINVYGMSTKEKTKLFEVRKNVGMVFQNPDNQMVASIVEDDIAFGPENIGVKREEIIERVDLALKAVGMSEFKTATPHRLSGGQKQRIAIAGMLALKPKVLILDESTAMLDPEGRKEVMEVIRKLNVEEKITIILITHFMDEATMADRVLVLNQGEIVMQGSPAEIFDNAKTLDAVGLTLPRARQFANMLEERGCFVGNDILTTEQLLEKLCQ